MLPLAACGGSAGSGDDATIELTVTTTVGENLNDDWVWMADEITKRTDGRVTFKTFYNGSLVGAPEALQAVQDGRADIGWISPTYQPADFPVWGVGQLQYVTDNPEAASQALHDMYDAGGPLTQDFDDSDVHPIGFLVFGPNVVGTSKPITSTKDLKRLLMRSGGTSDDILKAAGATPIDMPVNEVYEGLQRGTIDGFTQLPFVISAYLGLPEVTPYLTDIGSGPYASVAYGMNKDVWEDLPEDVQQVFNDVSAEFTSKYYEIQNKWNDDACKVYQKSDTKISQLPQTDIDELTDLSINTLVDDWKAMSVKAGFKRGDIDTFYDDYTKAIETAKPNATTYENPFESCS